MKHFLLFCSLLFTMALSAQSSPKVNLYPNPATDFVTLTFNEIIHSDVTVTISDILGNKIETFTYKPSESIKIDLSGLELMNGMYLIKIETGGSVFLKRLLIKAN